MLAASSVGMTSRLAVPFSLEFGKMFSRIASLSAASACISPSTSRSGERRCRIARALRIFCAEGELEDPKLECDSRSEEHTSELQSLMRISYAVFCLKKKKNYRNTYITTEAIDFNTIEQLHIPPEVYTSTK